ncbi:hypothetical protein MO973_22575 [Paenibacillus sp. TRM 82003]|nr:hypothetical protein [Paenibacillus sp. TRM 82003]
MKKALDAELDPIRFAGRDEVLRRTTAPGRRERLRAWWETELELPLAPVGAAAALLLAVGIGWFASYAPGEPGEDGSTADAGVKELIEAGGNTYWKDDYERAVAMLEDPN